MKIATVDIEANGFLDAVTKIHCIVIKDQDGIVTTIIQPSEVEHLNTLLNFDLIVGHNFISYDLMVLKKLFPSFSLSYTKVIDTYLLSRMLKPDLELHYDCPTTYNGKRIGQHSLENWGYYLGIGKIQNEDWEEFSENMLKRCIEDVNLTERLYKHLITIKG